MKSFGTHSVASRECKENLAHVPPSGDMSAESKYPNCQNPTTKHEKSSF